MFSGRTSPALPRKLEFIVKEWYVGFPETWFVFVQIVGQPDGMRCPLKFALGATAKFAAGLEGNGGGCRPYDRSNKAVRDVLFPVSAQRNCRTKAETIA